MDYKFSNEFLQDIANILEICMEKNTNSISVEFEINGKTLGIDMTFNVK